MAARKLWEPKLLGDCLDHVGRGFQMIHPRVEQAALQPANVLVFQGAVLPEGVVEKFKPVCF